MILEESDRQRLTGKALRPAASFPQKERCQQNQHNPYIPKGAE